MSDTHPLLENVKQWGKFRIENNVITEEMLTDELILSAALIERMPEFFEDSSRYMKAPVDRIFHSEDRATTITAHNVPFKAMWTGEMLNDLRFVSFVEKDCPELAEIMGYTNVKLEDPKLELLTILAAELEAELRAMWVGMEGKIYPFMPVLSSKGVENYMTKFSFHTRYGVIH
jgi:hypothetical protein